MKQKQKLSLCLILGATLAFTAYELIGHWFLMAVPMPVRHGVSILIGTALAVFIAAVSIQAIWRQQKELKELARLRDYLLLMQAHYLHLSPSARRDPKQQLEYEVLELQYAELQHRIAFDNPAARASAFLDLSELAQTHLPNLAVSYPFFPHAVSHLAAALCLEKETLPRDQVLDALSKLAVFASDNDPSLLTPLIDNLAHANRTAYRMLLDALVVRIAHADGIQDADLKPFLPVGRFTTSEEVDIRVLRELAGSALCQEAVAAQRVLQQADKTPSPEDPQSLQTERFTASALRDSRDALAGALRALPAPEDFPSEYAAHRNWKRIQPLALQDCFLAGADLKKARMHGADLRRAFLMAALLTDAWMPNADLTDSNLWTASLVGGSLQGATLWGADLRDATLTTAHLEGADLSRARLQGAYLIGTNLKDACLWQVVIADDTKKREHCADFTDANWWEARFTDIPTGSADAATEIWLKFTFPKDGLESLTKIPVNPFTHV